jgi:hypothetical protein
MPKRSREELIEHLKHQLGFLRASSAAFDAGREEEAQRLATTIRVLVHSTGQSVALLKQLGVQHQMRFLDTWQPPEATRPGVVLVRRWDAGLATIRLGSGTATFAAPLGAHPEGIRGPQPFRIWWKQSVIEDQTRTRFTRKELVLFMTNQAGGAHVDPDIASRWVALTKLNSLGWGYGDNALVVPAGPEDDPMGNPIPANIRQIAFEVETSITGFMGDLLDAGTAA